MNLYKVTLHYGYNYQKNFEFIVAAKNIENAQCLAEQTFKKYDYGSYKFHGIELLASEGQYSHPAILLIENASQNSL